MARVLIEQNDRPTAKPVYVTGFTQDERNTCVAAAIKSGNKLNDWALSVLLLAAKKELAVRRENNEK
jgi:hypothetical protein